MKQEPDALTSGALERGLRPGENDDSALLEVLRGDGGRDGRAPHRLLPHEVGVLHKVLRVRRAAGPTACKNKSKTVIFIAFNLILQ